MRKDGASKSGNRKERKDEHPEFLVTGIGASTGGLEALTEFFGHVPADSGIAYMVTLYLSPDHDDQLIQALSSVAQIPVLQVTDKTMVAPDHVYVISPSMHLILQDGFIEASSGLTSSDRRAPVDIFFRTLAKSYGARAIGVILSGTGANGSMGIKQIKESGGAAFVQSPREARFNEMPRNAIATELIDNIMVVAELPRCIIAYKESLGSVEIPEAADDHPEAPRQALRTIFAQLRVRTGHDFSNYKRPTLLRRIERRMNIRNLASLPAYAAFLIEHPEEAQSLLKDLLISVTHFFRDKKPFETLERDIIPRLFHEKTGSNQVRIWVPGCATGEEAYSIAMLCAERQQEMIDPPKVQIFATDIDESAISIGREGLYTLNDAADVSPERLQRFFTMEGDQYLVRREIREMIIFAAHNILKDPPFSNLDMASCRNMLIYLNSTAQERVMETLHFALKPGAFLFVGTSESVDSTSGLYSVVSREHHIYQSQAIGRRHIPVNDAAPVQKAANKRRIDLQNKEIHEQERITYGELHQHLLEQYAPPSIVVNTEYDILHLSERAGRYLQVAGGELSRNLLKLIRPELRLELRTAFYQATQRNMPAEARNLKVTVEDRTETINIQVRPVLNQGVASQGFLLVLFEQNHDGPAEELAYTSDEPIARQLEEELIRVKAQLRASSDQYEIQAEELKATNEELQAMNEELRSAAEELETNKEVLQSINEEIRTVNQELKVKIEEVSLTSNNLQNLINSANIGTIFLDRSFRVMLYTPAALEIFNLIPTDHSRALSDITNRFKNDTLMEDAQAVLDKLSVIEREMTLHDGRVFFVRYSPYRTEEDRIQGVVITFLEITARIQSEELLHNANERMRQAMDAGKIFSWEMDPVSRRLEWSENMEEVIGFPLLSNVDKTMQLIHPEDAVQALNAINLTLETGAPYVSEYRLVDPVSGQEYWFNSSGVLSKNSIDGSPRLVGITQNITDRKKADEAMRKSEQKYRTLFNSIDEGFYLVEVSWDEAGNPTDLYYLDENPAAVAMMGREAKGKYLSELNPGYEQHWRDSFGLTARTGESQRLEGFAAPNDMWFDYFFFKPEGVHDTKTVAVVFRNVTERKQSDEKLIKAARFSAFRIALNDAIRELSDPMEIQGAAMAIVGEHLLVDRVVYSEMSDEGKTVEIAGMYVRGDHAGPTGSFSADDFGKAGKLLREGKTFYTDDATGPRTENTGTLNAGYKAFLIVPLIKKGNWAANLGLYNKEQHTWTPETVQLVEETAEMIWTAVNRACAEMALRESEERLQLAISGANIFTWEVNLENNAVATSSNFNEVLGFPAASSTISNYEKIFPEDKELVELAMQKVGTGDGSLDIEHRIVNPISKDIIWVRVQGRFIQGNPNRIIGITQNVTSLKIGEQALKESESRFRTLTDVVPQIIWTNNAEGKANFFNERWYDYSGLSYDESYGLGWQAIVHPDDELLSVSIWEKALAAGEIFDAEYRLRNGKGDYNWFIGRNVPLRNDEGEITGWFGTATDIDELKLVQEALHESRERLRVTVESATEFAIITFDTNGMVEGWNSGASRIFGFSEAEMIGKSAEIIFTPEDRANGVPAKEFRDAREKGRAEDERWHLRRNGELLYMSGVMAPIYDGVLTGYVKVARDMTIQKNSEMALALSEERYRVALQSAEMAAWDWNIKEDKVQWNDQHYRLVGLEPETSLLDAAFFMQFVHPDDLAMVQAELSQALKNGLYQMDNFRILRSDGIVRWVSGYGRVIERSGNIATRMVGVMYDITDRVLVEQNLRDKQLQLEIAQRAARVGIWGYDLKNRLGIATPELLELLGYPFTGDTWELEIFLQLVFAEDRTNVRNAYRKAAVDKSALEVEFRMEHPTRGMQWMLMRGQYIPPYGKMNASLMGSIIDITERKLFEEQKDNFIGIASHELRTPVTSIKAYAEILEEMFGEAGDSKSAELMQKLDGQVDRLTELIRALLDTTSIVAGRMQFQYSEFNLDSLITETAESMMELHPTHSIKLELESNISITADRARIGQVLINLLSNAVKYSPKADKVEVSMKSDGQWATVCVKDYGIGVAEDIQHKIFDRFYRSGDAQTSTFSGLGLGLFISAGIIQEHEGTISVASKKGKGATFCFTLPLAGNSTNRKPERK